MNIIKFKDIVRPGDSKFNINLKGRYAYWINMRYIVPIEALEIHEYPHAEQNIGYLRSNKIMYWDMVKDEDIVKFVDYNATDDANDITSYIRANKYVTDPNITLDDIRGFRTWLATSLLELDQTNCGCQKNKLFSEAETHVLEFYAKNMYDSEVRWLSEFEKSSSILNQANECKCNNVFDAASNPAVFRAVNLYKSSIHDRMVRMFRDLSFWVNLPSSFLVEFKSYIDSILTTGLTIKTDTVDIVDCCCGSGGVELDPDLKNLSKALDMMISDQVCGNKNFIANSLYVWAERLYDKMYWN